MDDRTFIARVGGWLADGQGGDIPLGLDPASARGQVSHLLESLRKGSIEASDSPLTQSEIDLLRGACSQTASEGDPRLVLQDSDLVFEYVSKSIWPEPDFDERDELLIEASFAGWRAARSAAECGIAAKWWDRLDRLLERTSPLRASVEVAMAELGQQVDQPAVPWTDDPQVLAGILIRLDALTDSSPRRVADISSALYRVLHRASINSMDTELRFFLGEAALRAGACCRILSLWDEAGRFLDKAEAEFLVGNRPDDLGRLSYQRLALDAERRGFDLVLERAPELVKRLGDLGMCKDSLKAKMLHGAVLKESGQLARSADVFRRICSEAEKGGYRRLLAIASYNLVQIHCLRGDAQDALKESERTVSLLQSQGNRVGIAKLLWGLGYLFAGEKRSSEAIETFRSAQREFVALEMNADVAAIQLVIADLLIDMRQEEQAESEILAALPVIQQLTMVPEGIAALTLLRESLRLRSIDREALHDLRRYFRKSDP